MTQPSTAQPQQQGSERYGWYIVFVLCVCGVIAYIDRQIINLLVDDIKLDLDITDTQISLLQGFAFAVFYAIVAIPLGRLADSRNRRWLITIGILAWTGAAIACGLAQSYEQLFVARMMVGVGEAVLTPAGFSLLADLFKPQRLARPVSVFTSSSFFGSGIALIVGGGIISYLGSLDIVVLPIVGEVAMWQAAFIFGALPGIPLAVWFFFSVKEPERMAAPQHSAADYVDGFIPALRYLRSHARLFGCVFIGLSLLGAAQFSFGAWIPAYFMRVHEWTAGEIGQVQGSLFLVFGTAGVISGGWLTDVLHRRGMHDANLRTAALCALIAVPFALSAPLVANPSVAAVLLAPMMFFGTMPFGAGAAIIPGVAPPQYRAQLVALYLLIANLLGQAGGPSFVALVTDRVFESDLAVGKSLALVVPLLLIGGAAICMYGWRPLSKQMAVSYAPTTDISS